MTITLDYGTTGLDVHLPDERVTVIEPAHRPALADPHAALLDAIRRPLDSRPLREIARPGQRVAISVCDVTRAQPRRQQLLALFEEMPGIPRKDITILVATGTHRANTPAELERMLGADIMEQCRVVNHVARDATSLETVGTTPTGVPVRLNREWLAADLRLTTGFVEPHFFAGFSGGPKMIAPGLAGIETVLTLHDAARIGHPDAVGGTTEGNPIHDDIRAIARMVPSDFSVDVTLNREQQITRAFAGNMFAEHRAACAYAKETAMRGLSAPFDVVLTSNSGYPLDQNLYQAVKGMSAAARVVRQGGTIICAGECRDGLPAHGGFGEVLESRPDAAGLLEMIHAPGYSVPDQWQVQILAQILLKARVLMKADGLGPDALRAAHLTPIDDVGEAVRDALGRAGPGATLCVLPQGPQTIPYLATV